MEDPREGGSAPFPTVQEPLPPARENRKPLVREGLPPSYRMRADAHYVDQLDAPRAMTVQMIAVADIDGADENASPILSLVDSIRRHGVLEPLLVQTRDRRYRLLAGKRRLAAAISAGLHQV